MALIKCPECGGQISSTADVCIHCGYTWPKNDFPEIPEIGTKEYQRVIERLGEKFYNEIMDDLYGKKTWRFGDDVF